MTAWRVSNFTITSQTHVYHMEMDLYKPDFIVYSDKISLQKTRGFETFDIIGSKTGYRESDGKKAKFNWIHGFVQLSAHCIVVVDTGNHCLRSVDRISHRSSPFSVRCDKKRGGFVDGKNGRYNKSWSIIQNKKNKNQLMVTLADTYAVRIVDSRSGQIFLFIKSSKIFNDVHYLIQDYAGDIYITAGDRILKISYARQTITRIAGGPTGYKDASLLSSQFSSPYGLLLANKDTLLVADHTNREV